jgi:two-component system, NarL family, response regulator LiaR
VSTSVPEGGAPSCALLGIARLPLRILIADDNALVRAAMGETLRGVAEKLEIVEAENGEVAVKQALKVKPDLIILDLAMPVADGLTASREIAKVLPDIPILMHTMYWSAQVEFEARMAGIRKVVPKSDSSALLSAVRDTLNTPTAEPFSAPSAADIATGSLEDKIRQLCNELFETKDDEAQKRLFSKLQDALRQHIQRLRARVAERPRMGLASNPYPERKTAVQPTENSSSNSAKGKKP